jgi:HK97 gp10 family phage protein
MAVKGLQEVLKNLQKFGAAAAVEIDKTTELIIKDIVANAKINAPKNLGKLGQSIEKVKIKESNYKAVAHKEYAAYVEFGTGTKVQVPSEMQKIASQFKNKKSGSFEAGLRAIKDWCKNKGIDQSAAYPIFISILNKGIQARPFLYPAFVKGRKQYKKDLKDLLKVLTKKYG